MKKEENKIAIVDKEKFGPWAIVTRASSGIGKEFARQLAGSGLNLEFYSLVANKIWVIGLTLHSILIEKRKYRKRKGDLSDWSYGSNPCRFIMSPKNGGDLCAHWEGLGQAHTDLCLAIP